MELMERTGVICTPGDAFGSLGEGYVRFALVLPVETIRELVAVIDKSGILSR
jgi:LL-diaminopimelate aminotransferase